MNILVIGDGREIRLLLNELVREAAMVEWVVDMKDAIPQFEEMRRKEQNFDLIVICPDNGLADADELAAELKMMAENMPVVVVVQKGVRDNGAKAGIGLGNIDEIVPSLAMEPILTAFTRRSEKEARR